MNDNLNENNSKDEMIKRLAEFENSENFIKLNNTVRNIAYIIAYAVLTVSLWSSYFAYIKGNSEATFARISLYVFILVTITFVCGIIKSAVSIYLANLLEGKLNSYNCNEQELARNEKAARLIFAICNFLNRLIPNLFILFLGAAFIVAGVYFGLMAGENSQIGFLIIFPLMGLIAIIAYTIPTIASIREIISIHHEDDYRL